jgi:deoxyribodipyrimidine photo-lyase
MRILHWFRKDLRLEDNTALHEAARDAGGDVVPFYASEPAILGRPDMAAVRVHFVLDALAELAAGIERTGSHLALDHGDAPETVLRAARAANADGVYWNDEYEPSLRARDDATQTALEASGFRVRRFHDRLLVPPDAVHTAQGGPFVVYSPFRRACEAIPLGAPFAPVRRFAAHTLPRRPLATLAALGFDLRIPAWPSGARAARERLTRFVAEGLSRYATDRDRPAVEGVSRLSPHLKFGTLSPRTIVAAVQAAAHTDRTLAAAADKYVSELRWRDFYAHVMFHHPHAEHGAFRAAYDALPWSGSDAWFDAWREGRTGYPIVDAGMRELAGSGFMHNRVRMIVASFLVKDLLIDWRRGERHFMRHLVDGDLANNNGGWQWAAGTGTDAQPYFRIFNPVLQGSRFDADGEYVKRWVPELAQLASRWIHRPWEAPGDTLAAGGVSLGQNYPRPIVDHAEQRVLALEMFASVN